MSSQRGTAPDKVSGAARQAYTSPAEQLDVQGASEYLGTAPRFIRRVVFERRIPHYKVGGRLRFNRRDLDTYVRTTYVPAMGPVETS